MCFVASLSRQTVSVTDLGLHGVLIQALNFTARWASGQSMQVELESGVPAKLSNSILDHTINLLLLAATGKVVGIHSQPGQSNTGHTCHSITHLTRGTI